MSKGVHHFLRGHPAVRQPNELTFKERAAQKVADQMGSWRFIGIQTLVIILWIGYNGFAAVHWLHTGVFDVFPFILLNLAFSTQAAYAAPLLQLASNRQTTQMAELAVSTHAISAEIEDIVARISKMTECLHHNPETGPCSCGEKTV